MREKDIIELEYEDSQIVKKINKKITKCVDMENARNYNKSVLTKCE